MNTVTDWDKFQVDTISRFTYLKRNLIHRDLLAAVRRRSSAGALEVGVGSGAQSAALSRSVQPCVTVDNNRRILRAALPNLRRFGRDVSPVAADAFALPFGDGTFGVAFSQGLMEHFTDDEVRALLREQLRVASSVVFSVPSNHYPRQDVGNERLLSPEEWAEIVGPVMDPPYFRLECRYYHYDLEAVKYSMLARRWLGSFSVLVTIDRH